MLSPVVKDVSVLVVKRHVDEREQALSLAIDVAQLHQLAAINLLCVDHVEVVVGFAQVLQGVAHALVHSAAVMQSSNQHSALAEGALSEPDIEIELDDYRSYGRTKRSTLQVGK